MKAKIIMGMILGSSLAWAQPEMRSHDVQMECKNASQKITGKINGNRIVDYMVNVCGPQKAAVSLESGNKSVNFYIMAPGAMKALFNSSVEGLSYKGKLKDSGKYQIRLYMTRNAAKDTTEHDYVLNIKLKDKDGAGKGGDKDKSKDKGKKKDKVGKKKGKVHFDQKKNKNGIHFHAVQTGQNLTITPSGLANDNHPMEREIKGKVIRLDATDLNNDGSPEVIVVSKTDERQYIYAYATNKKKSLSELYMPPIDQYPDHKEFYGGGDRYIITIDSVTVSYPNKKMGGAANQFKSQKFGIKAGEAGWVFAPMGE